MKVIGREKIRPIHMMPGDSLVVTYRDQEGETVLCKTTIDATQAMVVDETVLFETTFEDRRALGGMVLEKKP